MQNKQFTSHQRVVTITYPYQEFTYVSDDGKMAELLSDAGTVHYRRLEFLEHCVPATQSMLTGVVGAVLCSAAQGQYT